MKNQQSKIAKGVKHIKFLSFLLCFGALIIALGLTMIAPLFPKEAVNRNVSEVMIGLVMGFNPLFSLLALIFLGNKKAFFIPKKMLLLIGTIFNVIATLVLGLIIYLPNDEKFLFVFFALTSRMFQGFGSSLVSNSLFGLIPLIFKHQNPVIIGLIQACTASGEIFGYVEGSFLFSIGGYTFPFYVTSFLMLIVFTLFLIFIPNLTRQQADTLVGNNNDNTNPNIIQANNQADNISTDSEINSQNSDYQSDSSSDQQESTVFYNENIQFDYVQNLCNLRLFTTLNLLFFPGFAFNYFNPFFSLYCERFLMIQAELSGYMFGILSITLMIASPLVGQLQLEKQIQKENLMGFGTFFYGIAFLLTGPAFFLGLEPSTLLCILTRIATGITTGCIYNPAILEITDVLTNNPINKLLPISKLQDSSVILYYFSWYSSEFLGQFSGGYVFANAGLENSSSYGTAVLGLMTMILGIFYLGLIKYQKKTKIESKIVEDSEESPQYEPILTNKQKYLAIN